MLQDHKTLTRHRRHTDKQTDKHTPDFADEDEWLCDFILPKILVDDDDDDVFDDYGPTFRPQTAYITTPSIEPYEVVVTSSSRDQHLDRNNNLNRNNKTLTRHIRAKFRTFVRKLKTRSSSLANLKDNLGCSLQNVRKYGLSQSMFTVRQEVLNDLSNVETADSFCYLESMSVRTLSGISYLSS